MKDKFYDNDAKQVIRESFLAWVHNKARIYTNLYNLFWEFEAKYFQLFIIERSLLDEKKINLFLDLIDQDICIRFESAIQDNSIENGYTKDWKEIKNK